MYFHFSLYLLCSFLFWSEVIFPANRYSSCLLSLCRQFTSKPQNKGMAVELAEGHYSWSMFMSKGNLFPRSQAPYVFDLSLGISLE